MKTPLLVLALALGCAAGCGKKDAAKAKAADEATSSGGNPAMAPLDYLAAQGRAKQVAIKVTSTVELTSAIQKFNAMEDRYPRDFNELIQQHYLQAMPAAPRGMAFAYNPTDGSVRVVAAPAPGAAPH